LLANSEERTRQTDRKEREEEKKTGRGEMSGRRRDGRDGSGKQPELVNSLCRS
jgi:hypothetical protein